MQHLLMNGYTPFTLEYYVYPNAFGASANSATNMVGKSDPNSNPESWSFGAKAKRNCGVVLLSGTYKDSPLPIQCHWKNGLI